MTKDHVIALVGLPAGIGLGLSMEWLWPAGDLRWGLMPLVWVVLVAVLKWREVAPLWQWVRHWGLLQICSLFLLGAMLVSFEKPRNAILYIPTWTIDLIENKSPTWLQFNKLLTRVLYDRDSLDDRFIIKECEIDAYKIGQFDSRSPDIEWATSRFRRCLRSEGLAWERCRVGEPDCAGFAEFQGIEPPPRGSIFVRPDSGQ